MKVGISIIDDLNDSSNEELRDFVKTSLRPPWMPRKYKHFSYLEHDNIDSLLRNTDEEIDVHIIQSAYHLIYNLEWFIQELKQLLDKHPNILVAGHILDMSAKLHSSNKYYGLHEQLVIVNMQQYKNLGCPDFGKAQKQPISLHQVQRSIENVHDDYTPTYLQSTGMMTLEKPVKDGWNFINKSMETNIPVVTITDQMRANKSFIYPKTSSNEFMQNLKDIRNGVPVNLEEKHSRNTLLKKIKASIDSKNYIGYIFNYEDYEEVTTLDTPLDTLIVLCSGFKPNVFLKRIGFHEKTHVIHYDISDTAIETWKTLIDTWNGKNLSEILHKIKPPINSIIHDHKKWNKVIEIFGSEKEFEEHWQQYKKLKHTFIKCDIIENSEQVVDLAKGNSLLWYSNCYSYKTTYYMFGSEKIRHKYKNMIETIKTKKPELVINGLLADTNEIVYERADATWERLNVRGI